jgi:hypothetical protein
MEVNTYASEQSLNEISRMYAGGRVESYQERLTTLIKRWSGTTLGDRYNMGKRLSKNDWRRWSKGEVVRHWEASIICIYMYLLPPSRNKRTSRFQRGNLRRAKWQNYPYSKTLIWRSVHLEIVSLWPGIIEKKKTNFLPGILPCADAGEKLLQLCPSG